VSDEVKIVMVMTAGVFLAFLAGVLVAGHRGW
jgi:hypothetical protein